LILPHDCGAAAPTPASLPVVHHRTLTPVPPALPLRTRHVTTSPRPHPLSRPLHVPCALCDVPPDPSLIHLTAALFLHAPSRPRLHCSRTLLLCAVTHANLTPMPMPRYSACSPAPTSHTLSPGSNTTACFENVPPAAGRALPPAALHRYGRRVRAVSCRLLIRCHTRPPPSLPRLAMRTCPPNHLRPHRPPLRRYACVAIAPLVSPLPPHRCCTMSAVTPPDYPPSFYPSSAVSPRSFSAAVHRSHACHSQHLHLLVAPSCPTCSLNSAHARACPVLVFYQAISLDQCYAAFITPAPASPYRYISFLVQSTAGYLAPPQYVSCVTVIFDLSR
jgi:hypothetical protein